MTSHKLANLSEPSKSERFGHAHVGHDQHSGDNPFRVEHGERWGHAHVGYDAHSGDKPLRVG